MDSTLNTEIEVDTTPIVEPGLLAKGRRILDSMKGASVSPPKRPQPTNRTNARKSSVDQERSAREAAPEAKRRKMTAQELDVVARGREQERAALRNVYQQLQAIPPGQKAPAALEAQRAAAMGEMRRFEEEQRLQRMQSMSAEQLFDNRDPALAAAAERHTRKTLSQALGSARDPSSGRFVARSKANKPELHEPSMEVTRLSPEAGPDHPEAELAAPAAEELQKVSAGFGALLGEGHHDRAADERIEAFSQASERLALLAREAREARSRDEAAYREQGLPALPKDSPRRRMLMDAATPPRRVGSAQRNRSLAPLDRHTNRLHADIVENPLWIAADYLDRTTAIDSVDARIHEDPEVRLAEQRYREAEEKVREAARALDDFEPQSGVRKVLSFVRGGPTSDADRLQQLHADMKAAALTIHESKRELEEAQRGARDYAASLHEEALAIQADARSRRDELEQPLREALFERHRAERALEGARLPNHLRDAQELGSLTYTGTQTLGSFTFHEFEVFGGGTFLADAVDLKAASDKLELVAGDRVVLRSDKHGARHMQLEERGVDWPRSRDLEGVVLEVDRDGTKVRGIQLREPSSGQARWIRPMSGDDLGQEFAPPVLQRVQTNDVIRIGPSGINITPGHARVHAQSAERAR